MSQSLEPDVSTPTTGDNVDNADVSILVSLSARHRVTKAGFKFSQLSLVERKQFYAEAVNHVTASPTGNLTAMEAACRVASMYNIVIQNCDRGRIKTTVNSRLITARSLLGHVDGVSSEQPVSSTTAIDNSGQKSRGEKRRRAPVVRAAAGNVDDADVCTLPSTKQQRQFKGASSHLEYQEAIKEEAAIAAKLFTAAAQTSGAPAVSVNLVVKGMHAALAAKGIEVCRKNML